MLRPLLLAALFPTIALNAQWTLIPSGTTSQFETFDFSGDVGLLQGGVLLRTTDGGDTWSPTSLGPGLHQDVCFADATTAYVAGAVSMAMFKSTNAGVSWVQLTPPTSNSLWGVSAPTANRVYFVGTGAVVWASTNGGLTFSIRDNEDAPGNNVDVDFVSDLVGYTATEPRHVYKTENGGLTWELSFQHPTSTVYRGISFLDADHGCVVGGGGAVAVTSNGGASWTVPAAVTTSYLHNVHFADVNNGMAVGLGGGVIRTTDGGATWFAEPSFTTNDLEAVYMFSPTSAIVAGEGGVIYRNDALATSITELDAPEELHVFVDPARSVAVVSLPSAWQGGSLTLQLMDATGRLVVDQVVQGNSSVELDLGNVAPGGYVGRAIAQSSALGWFRLAVPGK